MYLISAYFDGKADRTLTRYINGIAEVTGNQFMIENHVPAHMTILSVEAPSQDVLTEQFVNTVKSLESGEIIIPSVGQLLPYVFYATPVMNEYLLSMQKKMIDGFNDIDKVSVSKYYSKDSWLPHITLGKTLNEEQMRKAFEYSQKHFSPLTAKIIKIGLAKTNPHEDILIHDF